MTCKHARRSVCAGPRALRPAAPRPVAPGPRPVERRDVRACAADVGDDGSVRSRRQGPFVSESMQGPSPASASPVAAACTRCKQAHNTRCVPAGGGVRCSAPASQRGRAALRHSARAMR